MTAHLSIEEIVDAAEGRLPASRQPHLAACGGCAAEVAAHAAMFEAVADAKEIPEPSPLFWDHFSARTHAAIAASPATPSRWSRWLTPLLLGAAAATIALLVLVRPAGPPDDRPAADDAPVQPLVAVLPEVEDGPWPMVMDLAKELPWDDVQQIATPRTGTADGLIDELTPAEREAFVKLLKREIGDLE